MRSLRLLLLQARHASDPMRDHEHRCFADRTGLAPAQIVPHDLLSGPPTLAQVRAFDGLLMGGSGDFLVSQGDQPNFEPTLALLRDVVAARVPTFASCYGFQAMVHALGGEVIHDPENIEVGTFELSLTEEARRDELFGALPRRFVAQQGHKDRAARLPEGLVHLASSERAPYQALRVPGAPVWAVQFHPELDRDGSCTRYRHYLENYSPELSPEEVEAAMASFEDSPEASALLGRFLRVVFG
ncbi:MAG: gamma-glutamyl-gamma-aminobutyrate hydrolase family protein [Sandaracinaceae bacterium]|nr:gamma-glutamyl-gamma-aminobutyrate hydrolase family protein [Sandaracinaceae bacterium]